MRTISFVAVIVVVVAMGCGSRNRVLRDTDGNAYELKGMADGRTWLVDNLKLTHPDSYCYGDSATACIQYGRLYTWAAAVDACRLLGAGWQLPSDDEWRRLAKGYGGVRGDSESDGRAAYTALVRGGASGFNALLSGNRDPRGGYDRLERHGLYWSSTESDAAHARFYNFGRGGGLVNGHSRGDKAMALSVRCVEAADRRGY